MDMHISGRCLVTLRVPFCSIIVRGVVSARAESPRARPQLHCRGVSSSMCLWMFPHAQIQVLSLGAAGCESVMSAVEGSSFDAAGGALPIELAETKIQGTSLQRSMSCCYLSGVLCFRLSSGVIMHMAYTQRMCVYHCLLACRDLPTWIRHGRDSNGCTPVNQRRDAARAREMCVVLIAFMRSESYYLCVLCPPKRYVGTVSPMCSGCV